MDTLNVFFIADDEGRDEIGNDHVTAIFPEVPWSNVYLTGYARLGQHCAIYPGYIRDCRPATEAEYTDLLRELRGVYQEGPNPVSLRVVDAQGTGQ